MRVISFGDYVFSLRRGNLIESIKIIFSYIIKSTIFYFFGFLLIKKYERIDLDNVQKIGIYFPANAGLGDLVICDFFFKAVREKFPKAQIYIYTKNGNYINPLFYNELIDNSKINFKAQIASINSKKIDLFLLPEKSIVGSFVFLRCHAKYKIGYLDSFRIKSNFNIKKFDFIPNKIPYYLKSYTLLKLIFEELQENVPPFSPDLSFLKTNVIDNSGNYILFVPCVTWGNRTVSFEDAEIVVKSILDSGFSVFLSGGFESFDTNKRLIQSFLNYKDKIICKDPLNLVDFVNVIKNSKAVICGDSGPLYLSFGFKKQVLSFWGPTYPDLKINPNNKNENNIIYEKEKCHVINCYNMEHKPFCKNCLRLNNISNLKNKVNLFLSKLN